MLATINLEMRTIGGKVHQTALIKLCNEARFSIVEFIDTSREA